MKIVDKIRTLIDSRINDDEAYTMRIHEIVYHNLENGTITAQGRTLVEQEGKFISEREKSFYADFSSVYGDFDTLIESVSDKLRNLEPLDRSLDDESLETAALERHKKRMNLIGIRDDLIEFVFTLQWKINPYNRDFEDDPGECFGDIRHDYKSLIKADCILQEIRKGKTLEKILLRYLEVME